MADQSDVEAALVQLASAALYPDGVAAGPVVGGVVRLYRGWPHTAALDADLAAGRVNVTVFPVPNATRVTTRYMPDVPPDAVVPTLTARTDGTTAWFGGSADPGQLAGILVDGASYVHRTVAGDTPALVAAILASAIMADRPALAAGTSVVVPAAVSLAARTAADANTLQELRCQVAEFRVTAWCPSPALRDAICAAIDAVFAATPFLTLPGPVQARLRYAGTSTSDGKEDAALFRRDLTFRVEFPTTLTAPQPSMLFGAMGVGATTFTV